MARLGNRLGAFALLAAALLPGAGRAVAGQEAAGGLTLGLPLVCRPGVDCWIGNYMDDDPGPGAADFACGHRTYNNHHGTDFAIRDLRAMRAGVPVTAAAAGTVARLRDGMPDVAITAATRNSVAGRECGNGVVLKHGNGWETQYCHMRRGSLIVHPGEHVAAGQKLGLVGLSGMTQFPHVHITVRHDGKGIDPFIGAVRAKGCGLGKHPLWRADLLPALAYEPFAIYHAGFADRLPSAEAVRAGDFDGSTLTATAPVIVLWVEIFGVAKNDAVTLRLKGPDGATLAERRHVLKETQARHFEAIGRKRPAGGWPAGEYVGEITLARSGSGPGSPHEERVVRRAQLR